MRLGKVSSYIVAYVISIIIVVGSHGLFNLNPLISTLIPVRMYQYPQSVWDSYCYWYSTCPEWCKYLNIPRFATGTFEHIQRSFAPQQNRNKQLQNTRSQKYYPMLDKTSSAILSRLVNNSTKQLSRDRSAKSAVINNLFQTTLSNLRTTKTPAYVGAHSKSTSDIIKDFSKSGRRTGLSNRIEGIRDSKDDVTLSVLPNNAPLGEYVDNTKNAFVNVSPVTTQRVSQPPVLLQSTDLAQNTWNITTVPPLLEVTTESMQNFNGITDDTNTVNTSITASSDDRSLADESLQSTNQTKNDVLFRKYRAMLDQVERKFLLSVFTKLTAISPENRKENGISFLQSGFLLQQLLMALSIDADRNVTREIDGCLGLNISETEKMEMLQRASSLLPNSSDVLKFRWSSRLVLPRATAARAGAARAARVSLSWLNGTETAAQLAQDLNKKVELDSGGAMHDTFDEEEFADGTCAVALGTGYVRATWHAAPTLLNDSLPFHDAPSAPPRTSRFFRLNDVMGYAYLHEWDAEAIEISYATPGLTLLLLVPKEPALRPLVERVAARTLDRVLGVMSPVRVAVTLPLYTLRMTLLLPNKLEDMGIPSLILANGTDCDSLKFSHAVQRLMFWAEAGRNAFKDDGIEWDPHPELEIVVDRPYLFFIRWQNITIMNGAFVL